MLAQWQSTPDEAVLMISTVRYDVQQRVTAWRGLEPAEAQRTTPRAL